MIENKEDLSFGTIAVELGYITAEQLKDCIQIQEKIKELGVVPKKLGEIMTDKGYLTEPQVKHIFRVQGLKGGHTQIAGYKIMAQVGQGAMGAVYKAIQISMDRVVAVKTLAPRLAQNEQFVERFLKETRSVARLNHPNIIQGIDAGESHGVHYLVMEYIDGRTLDEIVKQRGPLEEKQGINIIMQISRGLEHAHKHNLVHRDIKPKNIMLTNSGVAKLCDLGLTQLVALAEQTSPRSPAASGGKRITMGTPAYISPEAARGDRDIDIRSDIYSLGATFYFALIGQAPFPAESATEAITKHLTENLVPPKEKNPQVSDIANQIITKMMAKRKEERYQTPGELKASLKEALAPPIIELAPEEPAPKSRRLVSRRRGLSRPKVSGRSKGLRQLRLRRRHPFRKPR